MVLGGVPAYDGCDVHVATHTLQLHRWRWARFRLHCLVSDTDHCISDQWLPAEYCSFSSPNSEVRESPETSLVLCHVDADRTRRKGTSYDYAVTVQATT